MYIKWPYKVGNITARQREYNTTCTSLEGGVYHKISLTGAPYMAMGY